MTDVLIIGCGITGASCAYFLSRYGLSVTVIEKNNDIACETTKANSAIVHAGFDPAPGTKAAALNVKGCEMMPGLCEKLDVPYKRVGSHVLAFSEEDRKTLEELLERGKKNGVPGLRIITREELSAMEPNVSRDAICSLYAPSAGIVSPWELALAMTETAVKNGVTLITEAPALSIAKTAGGFEVRTPKGLIETKLIINAAGLYCADIQRLAGGEVCSIRPCRGEYFLLDKPSVPLVNSVIFRCPDENGKGVLVAPTVHGNVIIGPNADYECQRDDVSNTAAGLEFVRNRALESVPGIDFSKNIRNFAGIRANHAGDDFIIRENPQTPGLFDIAGIRSPGLSAAPAIGLEACSWAVSRLGAKEKEEYCDSRRAIRFSKLSAAEKDRLIKKDPRYGRIVCRCENVTEAEIADAIHSPVPAVSVNAVKRRTNAGMGRCQGGFCGPRVAQILSRELGIPMEEVLLEGKGSNILTASKKEVKPE